MVQTSADGTVTRWRGPGTRLDTPVAPLPVVAAAATLVCLVVILLGVRRAGTSGTSGTSGNCGSDSAASSVGTEEGGPPACRLTTEPTKVAP